MAVASPSAFQAIREVTSKQRDSVSKLVWALADPAEYGCRFPTQDHPRTAFLRSTFTASLGNTPVANTTGGFDAGMTQVAFIGQPACAYMAWVPLPASDRTTLTARYSNMTGGLTTSVPLKVNGLWSLGFNLGANVILTAEADLDPTSLADSSGKFTFPVAYQNTHRYILCNINDAFLTTTTCSDAAMQAGLNIEVQLLKWNAKGQETLHDSVVVGSVAGAAFSTASFTIASVGWYRTRVMQIANPTAGALAVGAQLTAAVAITRNATTGWKQYPIPELDVATSGDPLIGQRLRVNGMSMLISNTSSALNKQGTIIAARVSADEDVTIFSKESLMSFNEKFSRPAETGVYTFKEFTLFNEPFKEVASLSNILFQYPLDRAGDHTHFITLGNDAYATAPNTFLVTVGYSLEFQTPVPRFAQGTSGLDNKLLQDARKLVASKPDWFYENPNHMAEIYNLIKRGAGKAIGFARSALPYAAPIVAATNPELAPLIAALEYLLHK